MPSVMDTVLLWAQLFRCDAKYEISPLDLWNRPYAAAGFCIMERLGAGDGS